MRKKYNKFGAKKIEWRGLKFDSKVELETYILLLSYQDKNKIVELQKIDKGCVLEDLGYYNVNSKKKKIRDVTYKPDLKFYAIDAEIFGYKFKHKNVIVEVKGEATAKLTDYKIRRRLFIKKYLDEHTIFLEVILSRGGKKIVLWEKI